MSETSAGKRDELNVDINNVRVYNNNVLIRVDVIPDDGHVLESGIIIGGSKWNEAGHVARYGEVVQVPSELKFQCDEAFPGTMSWGTELEIEVGDTVFFGKMASANSPALYSDGKTYYVINYQELILAKRGEEIIVLNGYALVEKVFNKVRVSGLSLDFGDHQDKRLGVVRYVGRKNDYYHGTDAVDADVEAGDEVAFQGNYWTEIEESMFSTLDENLGYVQRSWIICKL